MKKILSALFFAAPLLLFAQKGVLEGFVLDANTKKPMIGAVIKVGETDLGALSDESGHFAVRSLPAGASDVKITLIGFEPVIKNVLIPEAGTVQIQVELSAGDLKLEEVTVKAYQAHHQQTLSQLDIQLRPVVNSQEILRMVPGLFIGQHAGGGKAEQIFLRGFDIDHGTDIRLTVDGMPVNMVSHAHGQGYADLHFVIPELIEHVGFEKGPYHADKGNFVTAGWVDFRTRDVLDRDFAKLEVGQFGTARGVAALNLLGEKARQRNQSAYIAGEYSYSDSYFDAPQFFNRANVVARYNGAISTKTRLDLSVSHFWSRWNHSGQIPDRAVASGLTTFYGSVDPSEGGETSRSNMNVRLLTQTARGGLWKNQLFFSNYNFELYSNFTFFLENPTDGDQIRQKEKRNLFGYNGSYSIPSMIGNLHANTNIGIQYRQDLVGNIELSNTKNRSTTLRQIQLGDVNELNAGIFVDEELRLSSNWMLNIGGRYDFFANQYTNHLNEDQRQSAQAGLFSPKFNLFYTPNERVQAYLNLGKGFHSNDTRVVTPQEGKDILPPAYGSDVGMIWKPLPRLYLNPALWYLWLGQEFVYVGDAGVVEPSGRSQRYGFDLTARYQIAKHLFADLDLNWTHPRSLDDPAGQNLLPLAPVFTSVGGLSLTELKGFSGSLRYRYMADRPANEDNTITAKGYFIPDLQLNYARKKWQIGLNLQNLLNKKWKETQFGTESRLFNELAPVEEIHFTPGTPFFARLAFTLFF